MEPFDTLQKINNHYGRGDVVLVTMTRTGGHATIEYGWVAAGQPKMEEIRPFTIIGKKIRFRGVTRKIGYGDND